MLTQSEADHLIAMTKWFTTGGPLTLRPGTSQNIDLASSDPSQRFSLDVWRGTIRLTKVRYQNRARGSIVLVRLELDGPPHTNPDGATIGGTHIHVYREGYEDKWAVQLDPTWFKDTKDMIQSFKDFCRFCNITRLPMVQAALL